MPFGKRTNPNVNAVRYLCMYCHDECDPTAKGTARQVMGWVTPRDAGGANHIRFQNPTGAYAHVSCLEEDQIPVQALQQGMF